MREKLVLILYLSYWVQMWVRRRCHKKIFMSFVLTMSHLSLPIVALTNCSSRVVGFAILINKLTGRQTILCRCFFCFMIRFFKFSKTYVLELRLYVSNDSRALYFSVSTSFLYSWFNHMFHILRLAQVLELYLALHVQGTILLLDLVFKVLNWWTFSKCL